MKILKPTFAHPSLKLRTAQQGYGMAQLVQDDYYFNILIFEINWKFEI